MMNNKPTEPNIDAAVKRLKENKLTEDEFPDEIPVKIKKHFENAIKFQRIKAYLFRILEACGDNTLNTTNKNFIETLDQIIKGEIGELEMFLRAIEPLIDVGNAPRGMICPLTLTLMEDPVLATDGHSYERMALLEWFRNHVPDKISADESSSNQ